MTKRSELDAIVGDGDYPVSLLGVTGSAATAPLPPFGTIPSVVFEFGRALTWEEATKVARHPYIEALRLEDTGLIPTDNGCPIDTKAPIPTPECDDERGSAEGKWSASDEQAWSASSAPNDVMVQVVGGHMLCPPPSCPPRPSACPELDATQAYVEEWNWQSQTCVRALIAEVGGHATDERLFITNTIFADLTWQQIQQVGKHPSVKHIGRASSGSTTQQ